MNKGPLKIFKFDGVVIPLRLDIYNGFNFQKFSPTVFIAIILLKQPITTDPEFIFRRAIIINLFFRQNTSLCPPYSSSLLVHTVPHIVHRRYLSPLKRLLIIRGLLLRHRSVSLKAFIKIFVSSSLLLAASKKTVLNCGFGAKSFKFPLTTLLVDNVKFRTAGLIPSYIIETCALFHRRDNNNINQTSSAALRSERKVRYSNLNISLRKNRS